MKTFEELYCERSHCDASRFARRVFRASLPWYVRPLSVVFGGFGGRFFRADRDLILGAGEAQNLAQLEDDIRDYFMNPTNHRWLKKSFHLRISTQRLKAIAIASGIARASWNSGAYR